MKKMIGGIRQFRHGTFHEKKALFEKLSSGQSPEVLFITCSDSRVVPHLITGTEPGDMFVIRNAGNIVPEYTGGGTGEEAAIEFAVSILGVKHIIVSGHSDCGAMKGLLDPKMVASVPSVAKWLENERPTLEAVDAALGANASNDDRLTAAIEMNALRQIERLQGHHSVASALANQVLSLHVWVYEIGGGTVRAYDPARNAFAPLRDALIPINEPPKS